MKAIDKIIFNELASRRAVVLPGVGTLGVLRRTAQLDGREVKAPVNQVVFSDREADDAPQVIDIMVSMGLERTAAEEAYASWLDDVKIDDNLGINGVGTLLQGVFTPSSELEQMLNPLRSNNAARLPVSAPEPTPVPPITTPASYVPYVPERRNDGKDGKGGRVLTNTLLIIAILLLLAVGYLCVVKNGCYCGDNGKTKDANEAYNKAVESKPLHVVIGDEPPAPAPAPETKPVEPAVQQPGQPASPTGRKYHLIAGSFIYETNADELIAKLKRIDPNLKLEKIKTPSWVMVSVYQGGTPEEVKDANARLAGVLKNRDMWVYLRK